MAKLSYKVSYYVFYVCIALILVVLGMFYGVGYSETNAAGLVEPAYTQGIWSWDVLIQGLPDNLYG